MKSGGTAGRSWPRELGRFLEIQNLGLNLPFGVAFLFSASSGPPSIRVVILAVLALLAARNAGHAFNRWSDRAQDAANPRTQDRALVTGRLSPTFALLFAGTNAAVLAFVAALLNPLALALSPLALALIFGYSYTKRYTAATTVVLGLVEATVPVGVYIAVLGTVPVPAVVASAALLAWGTAFETIHSLGDLGVDRALGLHSLPLRLGVSTSVRLVPAFHGAALILFAVFALVSHLGFPFWVAWTLMVGLTADTDLTLARRIPEVRTPFQRHFLLALLFLVGVVLALALANLSV